MVKQDVFNACMQVIEEKIKMATLLMQDAQESANSDTKSSAGDKHETSRAMAMLEKDKAASQLYEANKLRQVLLQQNPAKKAEKVELGSLVRTNTGLFYISVGIGKIEVENKKIFCISLASPLGKVLINKIEGESVLFNQQKIKILSVV